MKKSISKRKKSTPKVSIDQNWSVLNPNAAGIDLGSREHWVAVPPEREAQSVRCFGTTTPELEALAEWLKKCQVSHVAMEATGVYWIPVYQLLERKGFKVLLVNARQIKNVSGRKTDVEDCQWIQRLHTYGLLGGSFRPADAYCVVRSLVRYRDELIAGRTTQVQHLQKAVLQMAYELYQVYQQKISRCEQELAAALERLPDRVNLQERPLAAKPKGKKLDPDLRLNLYRKLGVDLTAIESIGTTVALTVATEVGPDLGAFPTERHFCSWLGLSPDHRITGGRILSSHTRRVANRLSDALRLAATSLEHSASALGAFYRRMKRKLGAPQAITATAHKLARIIYRLLTHGEAYVRQGLEEYEQKTKARALKAIQKTAATFGFKLVPQESLAKVVS